MVSNVYQGIWSRFLDAQLSVDEQGVGPGPGRQPFIRNHHDAPQLSLNIFWRDVAQDRYHSLIAGEIAAQRL